MSLVTLLAESATKSVLLHNKLVGPTKNLGFVWLTDCLTYLLNLGFVSSFSLENNGENPGGPLWAAPSKEKEKNRKF